MAEPQPRHPDIGQKVSSAPEKLSDTCPTCGQSLARKALEQTVALPPEPERQYALARLAAEQETDKSKYTREMLIRQVISGTHPDLVATKAPTYLVGPDDSMGLLRKHYPPSSSVDSVED